MAVAVTELPTLARYVPRMSAEWDLNTSDPWQEIEGTLCYVDISGFTSLSEKLARRGRIGAEELTEVLNYVFGNMMGVAYERGGSLLKFGGDALLLIFVGSNHQTQAASAAVEMQEVLREARSYETSAGHLDLKMSVGLHSGLVHLFRVGESHKELILTGPAASMTTEMEETAVAGEILISPSLKAALPDAPEQSKGEGFLLNWRKPRIECCGFIPRSELDPDKFAEGMPVALREFLQHGRAEPEHHIATVGFIKYQGVDALMDEGGPAAVAEALDELVRNVQHAVDQEGVTFLASDIDQDGGKIIIVAGVPGVQVDDEGRVLRAARRIADNAGTLPLRIGVNQGHVFVGEIGTEIRATYTIMGDTVNLAARLMAAASPGEVYASPSALDKSHTLFDTTPLEPFYVKGKEKPVQAYAVGAETGRRPSQKGGALPFAGRKDELQRLHSIIDDLFAGKGNAVAITGERGIGKSRLVDEILPVLDTAIHVNIRAEPYGIGTPYRPLRDPVRALMGIARDDHEAMADELLEAVADLIPDQVQLAPLLADVAMIDMPSTPEVDQIDPKFRQDRTADMLIQLFMIVCRGPVFFEVEDGHYMDEASTHVMERLAAASSEKPWLVLTTRRDTGAGFDPKKEEIELGPLSDEDARELVLAATEAAPLRPHDVDVIVQRAGGLPLFLEEIIGAVRQAGGVESLPDSLDAVVSAQIDALPPLARRLLQFSSVLGRSFRISILNQLVEGEGVQLDRATRRELTGFLEPDGSDRLQFRHSIIRDVSYRSLSFKRRQALHIHAGEIAEEAAGDHPESAADVLALHFSAGEDYERAWHYSRIAGDQARNSYANADAATHYERALNAVNHLSGVDESEKADVWMALGDVNQLSGRFEGALEAYRTASRLIDEDVRKQVDLVIRRAEVRSKSGNYRAALRETASGRKLVQATSDESLADEALARLAVERASIRRWQEKPGEVLQEAKRAEEKARSAAELESLGRALELLDWAHWVLGQGDKAVNSDEALRVLEELGDLGGMARIYNSVGGFAYWQGQWDEAIAAYQKSAEASTRIGNDFQAALAEGNIAEVLINQNRLEEAQPIIERVVRILRASGHRTVSWAEIELARLLIRKGDYDEAEALLDEVEQRSEAVGEAMTVFNVKLQRADSMLQAGRVTEALGVLEELGGSEAAMAMFGPTLARIRGCALAVTGNPDDALAAVQSGLGQARDQGLLYDQAVLLELKNEVVSRAGDSPDPEDLREADRLLDRLNIRREPVLASL